MRIARALAQISHPNSVDELPVPELSNNARDIIRAIAIDQLEKSSGDRTRMIASVGIISIVADYIDGFIAYDYKVPAQPFVLEAWMNDSEQAIANASAFAPSMIQQRAHSFKENLIENILLSKSAAAIAEELKAITIGLVVEYPHRNLAGGRFSDVNLALTTMIDHASLSGNK